MVAYGGRNGGIWGKKWWHMGEEMVAYGGRNGGIWGKFFIDFPHEI
jgi:hypothetical protein